VGEIGFEIHVDHSPLPLARSFFYRPAPEPKWTAVDATAAAQTVELPAITEALAPRRVTPLVRFDLARWYDLKAPGTYRVTLRFTKGGLFDLEVNFPAQYFEITRP
jgi:hypothetical protein